MTQCFVLISQSTFFPFFVFPYPWPGAQALGRDQGGRGEPQEVDQLCEPNKRGDPRIAQKQTCRARQSSFVLKRTPMHRAVAIDLLTEAHQHADQEELRCLGKSTLFRNSRKNKQYHMGRH